MANVAHKNLTGADLHEPKGISSATADEVYVADGAGSGSWTTVPRAGLSADAQPGMVYLSTNTPSAASQSAFTSGFSSSYAVMQFELTNILPSVNGAPFFCQLSTDGGASYLSTGYLATAGGRGPAGFQAYDNYTAAIGLSFNTSGTDTSSNPYTAGGWTGTVKVFCLGSGYKYVTFQGVYLSNNGTSTGVLSGGGYHTTSSTINAVRFLPGSGSITGTIRMYGIRAS